MFKKGLSPTCSYCTCVAKAILVEAGRIACHVSIKKITCCSTVGACSGSGHSVKKTDSDGSSSTDLRSFSLCLIGLNPP